MDDVSNRRGRARVARVLLVDDEPSILSVLNTLLTVEGYQVVPIQDGNKAVQAMKSEEFDLLISDIRMTPINGMELLKLAHDLRPSMAVIMVTAFGSVETAVEALRMGAYDYVTKPFKIDELLITVERALEYKKTMSENIDLKAQVGALYKFESIVAESPAMKSLAEMLEHVAPTDTTVLICGESGTGKALVARTLHEHSGRKVAKFVPINCEAVPTAMLEAELFGYAKGASTDEAGGKEGVFESTSGIESLPLGIQERLVRMLQEKEISHPGSTSKIHVNVRILAGTSASLERLIREGKFREDLYYRLNVIPMEIKPLRERREDILPMVYHTIRKELGADAEMPTLEPQARDALLNYSWPGNVRELTLAMKHAISVSKSKVITKDDLPSGIVAASKSTGVAVPASTPAVDEYRGKSLKSFLRSQEKAYVEQVLEHTQGDKNQAAKALKISLATLYRKLPEKAKETGPETPRSQN
jgi:two-component system, NtrC family, response regulator PilR